MSYSETAGKNSAGAIHESGPCRQMNLIAGIIRKLPLREIVFSYAAPSVLFFV